MGKVKSSIAFMKNNNVDGQYDRTIEKNKSLLRYFMVEVPERIDNVERH